ncbi:hypothetical protein COCNU_02G009110 [Cocos nucifera]|uniref:J domain-containing protein n=1 Tax=Cocos nucifera TaxID=13894 RepID=A0A8K0HZZ5_COCNU|nr:hypothetical protein COCNU_02G009110 [Cocos nucifera]
MECNKDEALRAKEIAEKKFMEKDIAGAKKFALKAQNLFPLLEGISQLIATLDVYLASEVKVHGEKDWYAIMCINVSADDETLKKQYRKLALQLHPDKNKSVGAEGAFQLISEAWSVLSDKTKRLLYDQKRNVKGFQQKTSLGNKDSNGFYNFANSATSKARAPKGTSGPARTPPPPPPPPPSPPPPPRPSKPNTFWTSCNRCKMQYEYLRVYLNHNLLCPNCREPFLASETGFPTNGPNSSASWSASQQRQQNSNHNSTSKNVYGPGKSTSASGTGASGFQHGVGVHIDSYNNANFQWGPFSRTTGAASATASSAAAAQAANMVHQTYEKVRREREETQAAARKEEAFRRKIYASKRNASGSGNLYTGSSDSVSTRKRRGIGEDAGHDNGAAQTGRVGASEMERVDGGAGDFFKSRMNSRQFNLAREFSQLDIRNILIEKTKATIRKKLEEWNSAAAAKKEEKEKAKKKQKLNENDEEKLKDVVYGNANQDVSVDFESKGKPAIGKKDSSNDLNADSGKGVGESVTIHVPDPDFHDFDKDRTEKSIEGEQIWATYDNDDGMPRFYVIVQKVISLKPFKTRLSFLTSRNNREFGPLDWVDSGFTKSCGDFRVGRYETIDTINIFSHRVKFEKGPRGLIKILPRKGEIWALYRNWSADWDENTPDEVIHQYDMVEVLDEYSEEQGVCVIPLVKVAGFKTVFRRHVDPREARRVSREEMFRFSHQVPSYVLTGEEGQNAPKGCHELDPAATPLELLQVITETQEDKVM